MVEDVKFSAIITVIWDWILYEKWE